LIRTHDDDDAHGRGRGRTGRDLIAPNENDWRDQNKNARPMAELLANDVADHPRR
jgi:hypothetical protein